MCVCCFNNLNLWFSTVLTSRPSIVPTIFKGHMTFPVFLVILDKNEEFKNVSQFVPDKIF